MPHMQKSGLSTFPSHFQTPFGEHGSVGVENLAGQNTLPGGPISRFTGQWGQKPHFTLYCQFGGPQIMTPPGAGPTYPGPKNGLKYTCFLSQINGFSAKTG